MEMGEESREGNNCGQAEARPDTWETKNHIPLGSGGVLSTVQPPVRSQLQRQIAGTQDPAKLSSKFWNLSPLKF